MSIFSDENFYDLKKVFLFEVFFKKLKLILGFHMIALSGGNPKKIDWWIEKRLFFFSPFTSSMNTDYTCTPVCHLIYPKCELNELGKHEMTMKIKKKEMTNRTIEESEEKR